jgi:hypothetical protein
MTTLIPKFDFKNGGATPTGAINRPINEKLEEIASVLDFGADPTGVDDSTTAINQAFASGKSVFFGGIENTFRITATITLPVNGYAFGNGATITATINNSFFKLSNNCVVTGLNFVGNGTGAAQTGIYIDGGATFDEVSRTRVSNCYFENFGGAAYEVYRVVDAHQGNIFIGNTIKNCTVGVKISERGEYTTITGCNIDSCNTGIYIIGGNTAVTGCVISNSVDGIYLGRGANDAHGVITGCLINHSTRYCVHADNISVKDFRIQDCEFYYGDLWMSLSDGVTFSSCTFGSNPTFYFEGSNPTYFNACFFQTIPTFTNDFEGEASVTYYNGCSYLTNNQAGFSTTIGGGYVETKMTATQTITSSATPQTIILDTLVFNSMANHLNFTAFDFYDIATGAFSLNQLQAFNEWYCDADIAFAIGDTGTADLTKISVYLYDTLTGTTGHTANAGNFTSSYNLTDGTYTWRIFSFNGRVAKNSTYKIYIKNDTGVALSVFATNGNEIPAYAIFQGI